MEADLVHLSVLPRRAAVDPEVADRGRGNRRREPLAPLLDHRLPAALADHLLPAGDQHHLRVFRHLRRDRRHHAGRPGAVDADPGLQGVPRRREGGRPRRLVRAIGDPDVHRHHAYGTAVPLHRAQGAVLAMVENRPWLTFFSHAVLIAGVLAVAFPLYVTFVASTLSLEQIMQVPMPLTPGDQLGQNYSQALRAGNTTGSAPARCGSSGTGFCRSPSPPWRRLS